MHLLRTIVPRALLLPLCVGTMLRAVAAVVGVGFYAMDDYFSVLHPAWTWLADPEAPLPYSFRSGFMPMLLYGVMKVLTGLGAGQPQPMISLTLFALGLWSLVTIVGSWHLARLLADERVATITAWLCALQFLMPHTATRALVEAAASPALVTCTLCVAWVHAGRTGPRLWVSALGGLLAGLGVLFRFQVGLLIPVWMVLLAWTPAERLSRRSLAAPLAFVAGGIPAILVQGFVDLETHGAFFVSPFRYFAYQAEYVNSYGRMAWYTYVGFFFAVTLPPAGLALWRGMWTAARRFLVVSVPFGAFFLFHSAVGHKEERYMNTVLPLFFVLMASAMASAWTSTTWRRLSVLGFWTMNAVLLVFYTLSDPRRNVTTPLLEVAQAPDRPAVLGLTQTIRVAAMYLGPGGTALETRSVDDLLERAGTVKEPRLRLLLAQEEWPIDPRALAASGWDCGEPRTCEGDWIDQFLVFVNPKNNRSRRPSLVVDCTRVADGGAPR